MKETMNNLVSVICDYLRIDENLFFASKNQTRIIDAKKYFSYMAYKRLNIPASKVSSYLGVSLRRSSITHERASSVERALFNDENSQIAIDIKNIEKILRSGEQLNLTRTNPVK